MGKTILIIALFAITQSYSSLVQANPHHLGNNFLSFPFEARSGRPAPHPVGPTFFGIQVRPHEVRIAGPAPPRKPAPPGKPTPQGKPAPPVAPFDLLSIGQDVEEGIDNILHTIASGIEQRIENAKKYAGILGDNLKGLSENIQYRALRGYFLLLKASLDNVSTFGDILKDTEKKLQQQVDDQVTKVDNELLEGLSEWSSVLLERQAERTDNNEWAQAQTEQLINEITNRYGQLQESCKEEAYAELKTYTDDINTALDNVDELQNESLTVIQKCIASNANTRDCIRSVNDLNRKLRLSTYALRNLNVEGIRLSSPRNSYANRRCVVQNQQELQFEKLGIEIAIEVIRIQAPNHPNPTQGTTTTIEPTTESTSQGSSSSNAPSSTESTSQGSSSSNAPSSTESTTQASSSSNAPSSTESTSQSSSTNDDQTTDDPSQSSSTNDDQTTENSA